MKKSSEDADNANKNCESLNLSPSKVRKHQITPRQAKSKSSKNENSHDVHSLSNPTTPRSRLSRSRGLNSPSGSIPCSQDCPEVIWDYNSPKFSKAVSRRDSLTVEDFMKNLYQSQNIPECASQASNCIKLLEKWMASQNAGASTSKCRGLKKKADSRKNSCNIEAMKEFLESMKEKKAALNRTSNSKTPIKDIKAMNDKQKTFIFGDNSDYDSAEELWDEIDYNFLVKATQELETYPLKVNENPENIEILSSIPETLNNTNNSNINVISLESEQNVSPKASCTKSLKIVNIEGKSENSESSSDESNKKSFNFKSLKKSNKQITMSELLAYDWDAKLQECEKEELDIYNQDTVLLLGYDCDNNWDDEFSIDEESMSQIPDEILNGESACEISNLELTSDKPIT